MPKKTSKKGDADPVKTPIRTPQEARADYDNAAEAAREAAAQVDTTARAVEDIKGKWADDMENPEAVKAIKEAETTHVNARVNADTAEKTREVMYQQSGEEIRVYNALKSSASTVLVQQGKEPTDAAIEEAIEAIEQKLGGNALPSSSDMGKIATLASEALTDDGDNEDGDKDKPPPKSALPNKGDPDPDEVPASGPLAADGQKVNADKIMKRFVGKNPIDANFGLPPKDSGTGVPSREGAENAADLEITVDAIARTFVRDAAEADNRRVVVGDKNSNEDAVILVQTGSAEYDAAMAIGGGDS